MENYIGEIRCFAFTYAPKGWTVCAGQLLQIHENQPLFSLIGTIYGGDGRDTFALPDLRGSSPVGMGHSWKSVEHKMGNKIFGDVDGDGTHQHQLGFLPMLWCICVDGVFPEKGDQGWMG